MFQKIKWVIEEESGSQGPNHQFTKYKGPQDIKFIFISPLQHWVTTSTAGNSNLKGENLSFLCRVAHLDIRRAHLYLALCTAFRQCGPGKGRDHLPKNAQWASKLIALLSNFIKSFTTLSNKKLSHNYTIPLLLKSIFVVFNVVWKIWCFLELKTIVPL